MKHYTWHHKGFPILLIALFIIVILSSCKKEDNNHQLTKIKVESQTITSTINGGDWSNPKTWIGNVVPGEKSDVVISGRVKIKSNVKCLNLMIDNAAILEVEKDAKIKVLYHIINEGIVINNGTFDIPKDN